MNDDELIVLALAGNAISSKDAAAMIERHRAEVERLTRERDALWLFKLNMRLRNDPQHDAQVAIERAEAAESALAAAQKRIAELEDVVEFYADPGTYFAIAFLGDPPCGDFAHDFSETELGEKPGKRARAVLAGKEDGDA